MVETENNHKALLKIQKDEIKIDCRDSLERLETTFKGGKREHLGNHRSHNFNLMVKSWSKSSKEKETGNFNVGKLSLT